jgi:two-component system, LuxR family, response regulator FixJ
MTAPFIIHIIAGDHKRRAQIAHCAFAMGHHAEVYSEIEELAERATPDGVVVALEDAVNGGIEDLVGRLNRNGRWMTVIAASPEPTVEKAVAAVKQGAFDYLPYPLDPVLFARTMAAVANETGELRDRGRRRELARARIARLSEREREVLEGMSGGLTNKEIAIRLGISPRTVEIHRSNVIGKLAAKHSADALRVWFEAEFPSESRRRVAG